MKYSDKEIIEKVKLEKANDVVNYLYKDSYPNIKRLIMSKGAGEEHVKDAFQEAVMVLVQKILALKKGEVLKISGFLYSVAYNKWIDSIRKDKKMEFSDEYEKHEKVVFDQYEFIFSKERKEIIDEVIGAIGDSCRSILRLVLYSNYSMKEVAEEMKFASVDSAKTQHYKCRQKLIKKFKSNLALKEALRNG